MPNVNPYATGTNVYRGGSNVATMGKVDPMGYVNRELNNRRSQLAQGMLQNMGQQRSQQQPISPFMLDPRHVGLLAVREMARGNNGSQY